MDSRLIVIDSKNKTVRQLKIDRDTMAEVTVLGMLGNPVGTTQMQISLAHGFGDGKEESCGYARDAVSRLLQGENIDFYLAMSLDGISVLNDLAGGVTVTLEDDFSAIDPAMTKGTTLTLQGEQADGRDDANQIRRHIQYFLADEIQHLNDNVHGFLLFLSWFLADISRRP